MKEEEYHKILEMINSFIDPKDIGIDKIREFWKETLKREKWNEPSKQDSRVSSEEEKQNS